MGAGYDIKNIRNKSFTVCTNHQWGSAFRGYGGPQSALATEVAVDMMAAELGMDPWELRYKIFTEKKIIPPHQPAVNQMFTAWKL